MTVNRSNDVLQIQRNVVHIIFINVNLVENSFAGVIDI